MYYVRRTIIKIIRLYQWWVSPILGTHCRYYPSCSEYTRIALIRHGLIKGILLGLYRVVRCNPYSEGGVDAVPD